MIATASAPTGYRETGSGSGLIVPAGLERKREVWTRDEERAVDRVSRLFHQRHVKMTLTCEQPGCRGHLLRVQDGPTDDWLLRCDCRDRVLTRAL